MKRIHSLAYAVALLAVTMARFGAAAEASASQPAEPSEFMRYVDDKSGGGKVETAIVSYRNKAGVSVDLIAAVHVGEKAYYDKLQKKFESYDALLYEMVKPKGSRPPTLGEQSHSGISSFQRFLKDVLDLDFQLDDIDYTRQNFVHADLDAETFLSLQKERGESIMGIMLHSMIREMEREAAGNGPKEQITAFDLLVAMRAPDRPRQFKLLLGRQLGEIEDQMAGLDGPDGSVIITERNKKCLETLSQAIKDGDKHIGIFFGAGHMHDMSKRLTEMGFHQTAKEWRVSWDMTAAAPTTQPGK